MNMINSPSTRGKVTGRMTCVCCSEVYRSKWRKKTKRHIRKLEKIMWSKDWGVE